MLVTLDAQRGRQEQEQGYLHRQSSTASEQNTSQLSAAASSTTAPALQPKRAPLRQPISSLTQTTAAPIRETVSDAPLSVPTPLPSTAPQSASASSQPYSGSGSGDGSAARETGEDGLTLQLEQLSLAQSPSQARLTPLQALAARPRNTAASTSTRPATDTAVARRLVMGALGIRNERSEGEKENERQARREHQRLRREQLEAQRKRAEDEQSHAVCRSTDAATASEKAEAT